MRRAAPKLCPKLLRSGAPVLQRGPQLLRPGLCSELCPELCSQVLPRRPQLLLPHADLLQRESQLLLPHADLLQRGSQLLRSGQEMLLVRELKPLRVGVGLLPSCSTILEDSATEGLNITDVTPTRLFNPCS